MNPLFLALIYFGVIVPVGLFFRLRGKVFLSLKFDPSAKSYWIDSQKIKSANMINQF